MAVTKIHPINFIVDFEPIRGPQYTLPSYMKEEPGYDLAFCRAWEVIDTAKDAPLENPKEFLTLLDKVLSCAISHLSSTVVPRERVNGLGTYDLKQDSRSDIEGIKDLIRNIWLHKAPFQLTTYLAERTNFYALVPDGLALRDQQAGTCTTVKTKEDDRSQSINDIFAILLPLYSRSDNRVSMSLTNTLSKREMKESRALERIDAYFKEVSSKSTPEEKIRAIALFIRDLEQLHLYCDGNGRTLYMFANLLMYQNGLPLFYPRNMCMFDANSLETMVKEITEGQQRFTEMVGSLPELTKGLQEYKAAIIELQELIKNFPALKESYEDRNLNLLLRKAAAGGERSFPVLRFLVEHLSVLDINPFARGEKSGTALDIAKSNGNSEAVSLLQALRV